MKTERCCSHCPGDRATRSSGHECCLPQYVAGNLRISSLRKRCCPGESAAADEKASRRAPTPDGPTSCYDKFAFAKKLHAENLEHQPLPDRVDDDVFKNVNPQQSGNCPRVSPCDCKCNRSPEDEPSDKKSALRYGPVLGCKKPETRMDLAICWETPVNPIYEPRKPAHVDGSNGGLAPAIFALVHHSPDAAASALRTAESPDKRKDECRCCCRCLCRDMDRVSLTEQPDKQEKPPARSFRRCAACAVKKSERAEADPRLIKSAVPVGLPEKNAAPRKRSGLPTKPLVPRPRTPFARRSFCIDTLAPPFSVVNGCRDADYPEHWRLTSVYQQSYRNPQKRRRAHQR